MKGKTLRVICVGKIKTEYWKQACAHYQKLVSRWRCLECLEVKDGDSRLEPEARRRQEGRRILELLADRDMAIALSEEGQSLSSRQFAALLENADMNGGRRLAFIIGGPFGLDGSVLARCSLRLSLSAMTWPHELARVMLFEQLFRAESILHKLPYHH